MGFFSLSSYCCHDLLSNRQKRVTGFTLWSFKYQTSADPKGPPLDRSYVNVFSYISSLKQPIQTTWHAPNVSWNLREEKAHLLGLRGYNTQKPNTSDQQRSQKQHLTWMFAVSGSATTAVASWYPSTATVGGGNTSRLQLRCKHFELRNKHRQTHAVNEPLMMLNNILRRPSLWRGLLWKPAICNFSQRVLRFRRRLKTKQGPQIVQSSQNALSIFAPQPLFCPRGKRDEPCPSN